MVRTALLFAVPPVVAFAIACIIPPDDATQIAALARDRAAAVARGDRAALYRLHDLDFRAVCPPALFSTLPMPESETVLDVREIEVHGVRGSATVETETGGGRRSERRQFVKD